MSSPLSIHSPSRSSSTMALDSFFMEERSWWYPPAEKPEELLPPSSAADRYSHLKIRHKPTVTVLCLSGKSESTKPKPMVACTHAPTPVLLLKFSQPLLKWPSSSSLLSYLLKQTLMAF